MSMPRLMTFWIIILALLLGACGNEQSEIEGKIAEAWTKIRTIEQRTNAKDAEVRRLLENSERRLNQAKNHLTEAEYFEAKAMADDVLFQLDNFIRFGQGSVVPASKGNFEFDGRVQFHAINETEWQRLDKDVRLEEVAALKISPRSQARFKLKDGTSFVVEADSELTVNSYDPSASAISLKLAFGTIRVEKKDSDGRVAVNLDGFTMTAQGDADMEVAFNQVTKVGYACLYEGALAYRGETTGTLNKLEALSWSSGSVKKVNLPPLMRIENPANHDTVQITAGDTAMVDFRWYTQLEHSSFQLQVSEDKNFATRVFDNRLIRDNFHETALKEGEYHWRVRGFVADEMGNRVPAAFTQGMVLYVSASGIVVKPTGEDDQKSIASGAKKPDLDDIRLQAIGNSVIVTGRTGAGMRVKANGTSAIVNDDGSFRAIIDLKPGQRVVRLVVTDPLSGARTIQEKKL